MNDIARRWRQPPTSILLVTLRIPTVADEIGATEVFKQFVVDQWSDTVKELVAACYLALGSTDVTKVHARAHVPWFVFLSIVAPTQMRSSTSIAVFSLSQSCW